MLFDIALMMLAFLLSIPLLCAYYAHSRGRSFALWFFIGCALPIVSYFILLLLPDESDPAERQVDELRLQLGILGTKTENPLGSPLRKIADQACHQLAFTHEASAYHGEAVMQIWVDGQPLLEHIRKAEGYPLNTHFEGLALKVAAPPSWHLQGRPLYAYQGPHGQTLLMLHGVEHDRYRMAIAAKVEMQMQRIIWHSFVLLQGNTTIPLGKVRPFVFERLAYIDALNGTATPISQKPQ